MKKIASYNFSVDVIRVLAIFGVVAIHTANSVFERPDFFGGKSWWVAIIINSVSRICIPLFIMVSGYLLLLKNESFKITLKRIFGRLVIPLVCWTILNYLLTNIKDFSAIFTPRFYLRFLAGDVSSFYFLVLLIGLYFISPLIRTYLNNSSIKAQKYLGLLFLLVGIVETAAEYLIRTCAVENSFTKWVPYTGLFVIGYLIGTKKLKFNNKTLLSGLYFVGLIATIGLNYLYYSSGSIYILRTNYVGCITHYSDTYLSINVVLMSVAAFALLFKPNLKSIKNKLLEKIVYLIARASFGIYLVHLFIVTIWDRWLKWDVDNTSLPLWAYVIVKWLGVFVISFILAIVIRKTRFIRRLFGEDK